MTRLQSRLLRFIATYQAENSGISPSYSEMATALGLKSKGQVARIIGALEEQGFIARLKHATRAIQILMLPEDSILDHLITQAPPCLAEAKEWLEGHGLRIALIRVAAASDTPIDHSEGDAHE
jgi:repressor LexA